MIRLVVRMCAVAALRDKTWAADRVYDSDNTPLVDKLTAEIKPYMTVFTDTDNRMEVDGMDVYSTQRNLSLVVELGLASATVVEKGDKTISIPQTDQAMEAFIDLLEMQVMSALIGDPNSKWGDLFKQLVTKVLRMPSRRGGSSDKGTRWAARQLTLVCQPIGDPIPGLVLSNAHPIKQFIALARADDQEGLNLAVAADLIENALETAGNPDYQKAQAWLGLSLRGVQSLGIAPLPAGDLNSVGFEEGEVEPDDSLDTHTPGPPASFP
jgi:hypothetical protein